MDTDLNTIVNKMVVRFRECYAQVIVRQHTKESILFAVTDALNLKEVREYFFAGKPNDWDGILHIDVQPLLLAYPRLHEFSDAGDLFDCFRHMLDSIKVRELVHRGYFPHILHESGREGWVVLEIDRDRTEWFLHGNGNERTQDINDAYQFTELWIAEAVSQSTGMPYVTALRNYR